jgi:hypothetical protein
MYPFLVLGLGLSTWSLIKLAESDANKTRRYCALYLFGSLFAIYSHFVALPYLASINMAALVALLSGSADRRHLPVLFGVNIAVLLLSAPWFLHVYRTVGSFPGLGSEESDWRTLIYFIRNAVAYAGLPRMINAPVLALLFATALAGAVVAWRKGRLVFSAVLLTSLVLYPLLIVAIHQKTPILAARVFLPMIIPLLLLIGAFLSSSRIVGWVIGATLVSAGAAASVYEHSVRTKFDNPTAALQTLVAEGLEDVPLVTCLIFEAGSLLIGAEQLKVPNPNIFILRGSEAMRFDQEYFEAVNMSLARLRAASAAEIDAFLGSKYSVAGGLRGIAAEQQHVAVISATCGDEYIADLTRELNELGFDQQDEWDFRRQGRVVMEQGFTRLFLFERQPRSGT